MVIGALYSLTVKHDVNHEEERLTGVYYYYYCYYYYCSYHHRHRHHHYLYSPLPILFHQMYPSTITKDIVSHWP